MRELKQLGLDWHILRWKNFKYYSYVSWGHAEVNVLLHTKGRSRGWVKYPFSPELSRRMRENLEKYSEEKDLIFGLSYKVWRAWNLKPYGEDWIKKQRLWDIDWTPYTVFSGASKQGTLFPAIKELRKHKIIVIGPEFLRLVSQKLFQFIDFIEIHPTQGWSDLSIIKRVLECKEKYGNGIVYSFSMGIGSCLTIPTLHRSMRGNFLIDFGSTWDNFCGRLSRSYMKPLRYPKSKLWRNLGKSEEKCLKQEQLERTERPQLEKKLRKQRQLKLKLQQHTHVKFKRRK